MVPKSITSSAIFRHQRVQQTSWLTNQNVLHESIFFQRLIAASLLNLFQKGIVNFFYLKLTVDNLQFLNHLLSPY